MEGRYVVNWKGSASTILPVEDLHRVRGVVDVSKQNPKQGKAMQKSASSEVWFAS